jgi:hypothetical protein
MDILPIFDAPAWMRPSAGRSATLDLPSDGPYCAHWVNTREPSSWRQIWQREGCVALGLDEPEAANTPALQELMLVLDEPKVAPLGHLRQKVVSGGSVIEATRIRQPRWSRWIGANPSPLYLTQLSSRRISLWLELGGFDFFQAQSADRNWLLTRFRLRPRMSNGS